MQIIIAAKTDVGAVRKNNEDNFQAAADLSSGKMQWVGNEIVTPGELGALLVVADGMGGANAGEVASETAVETIKEWFSPERLSPEVIRDRFSIERHMNEAIIAADRKVKAEAEGVPERRGMGTTVVIGWILDSKLYVSWCGDSRAYVYNPASGLRQISKDHSYVQTLVDKGTITPEEAFDFPHSNIITRCLCDSPTKAEPESLLHPYPLCDGDIVLLCSDGLSGMLRDAEMERIIRDNMEDLDGLADTLIGEACEAGGHDNITVCLCRTLDTGRACETEEPTSPDAQEDLKEYPPEEPAEKRPRKIFTVWFIIALLAVLALYWYLWSGFPS